MENIIAVEIIKREVYGNIELLSDKSKIKDIVKYDNYAINKKLSNEFKSVINVLQNVIDAYYFSYYEVSPFVELSLSNLDYALDENLKTLNSMKKLLKFVEWNQQIKT